MQNIAMESSPSVDMSNEMLRIASFGTNPPKPVTSFSHIQFSAAFPSSLKLSKAGFYRECTANGDEVRCFACGLVLNNWKKYYDRSPMSLHLCKRPTCPFVTCQNAKKTESGSTGSLTPPSSDSPFFTPAEMMIVRRQLFPSDEPASVSFKNNNNQALTTVQIQANIRLPFSPKIGGVDSMFESKRLETFAKYPCVKAPELAADGFVAMFYRKIGCVFCGKKADCITDIQDVREFHRNLSPNCPFVHELDMGNVSLQLESDVKSECDNCEMDHNNVSVETPSAPRSPVFYNPHFGDFTNRLGSFMDWPPMMKPSAQQLSEAGFYYTGVLDKVTCHVCGCSLRKWRGDPDALVEHIRHSPNCMFVKDLPQYYEMKQLAAEREEASICELPTENGPVTNNSPVKLPSPFKQTVDPSVVLQCQAALASQFGLNLPLPQIQDAICEFYSIFNAYPNLDLLIGHMLTTKKEFQLLQEMRGNIYCQDQQIQHRDQQIQHRDQQIQDHRQQIQHRDQEVSSQGEQILSKDDEIWWLKEQLKQKELQHADELKQKDQQLSQRDQQLSQRDQQIISKNYFLQAHGDRIDQLAQDNIRMQNLVMQLRRELQTCTSRRG